MCLWPMKLLKLREFSRFELNLSVEQTFLSEDGFMALGPEREKCPVIRESVNQ